MAPIPPTAVMCGCTVREFPTAADGDMDIDALRNLLGRRTAGIMLTNPSTLGVFERRIEEVQKIVHDAGGLLYYDGANLNAILGKVLPCDMGFDVIHINLHKTFSTPHGGGGPGSGAVGVGERLQPFLPTPFVGKGPDGYRWVDAADHPKSIGRLSAFMGNAGVLLRAYIYMRMLGRRGMERVADYAVLNANYLMAQLAAAGFDPAYPQRLACHEFVVTLKRQAREHDLTAMNLAKALLDRGFHAPTTYFPLLVPECPAHRAHRDREQGDPGPVHRRHGGHPCGGAGGSGAVQARPVDDAGAPPGRGPRGAAAGSALRAFFGLGSAKRGYNRRHEDDQQIRRAGDVGLRGDHRNPGSGAILERYPGRDFNRGGLHPRGQHPGLRYRAQPVQPGHGLRGGCRTGPDPDQPSRGHARSSGRPGHLPQPGGSGPRARVPRPGARLRLLPLRPGGASVHRTRGTAAGARGGPDRPRHSRGGQRRRRTAFHPGRDHRPAGPPGAQLRTRQLQRLQYFLPAGGFGHLRRFVRLSGDRHRGPGGGAQRRRQFPGGIELLSAAGPGEPGVQSDTGRPARPPGHTAERIRVQALCRTQAPRAVRGNRSPHPGSIPGPDRVARG